MKVNYKGLKLIKRISTKVRRRKDYDVDARHRGTYLYSWVGMRIDAKIFGIFWITVERYWYSYHKKE